MRNPKRLLCFLTIMLFLFAPAAAAEERTAWALGSKGAEVLQIKKKLQELRYIASGSLTKEYTEKTAKAVFSFQEYNNLPANGEVDSETWERLFSEDAVSMPYATLPPLNPAVNTPPPPEWPERDEKGYLMKTGEFFHEDDENGYWVYLSQDLQIQICRKTDFGIPMIWFETDIKMRNGESFHAALTDPEHPGKQLQYPYVISRNEQFVLGFTDDFFAARMSDHKSTGVIIRNGRIISEETNRKRGHHLPNLDMMVQYPDGKLEVLECNEYSAEELLNKGAVNVFSFGPILIRDGIINEMVYTWYRDTEARQALGMIEPGHYLLLSVQGRIKKSRGTMLQRVAEMMKEKGVTDALNLDGGNTMALVFRGRMLNKLATYRKKSFVRTVTSIIGVGHTESQDE